MANNGSSRIPMYIARFCAVLLPITIDRDQLHSPGFRAESMLWRMHLFFGFALFIWAGMNAYVIWRISSIPAIVRYVPRLALWISGTLLSMSYIGARILGHTGSSSFSRILEIAGANWIGAGFLLFASLLLIDTITGFGSIMTIIAPRLRACGLMIGASLSACAILQGMRAPVVQAYDVQLSGLPPASDGRVLVFASDLHLGTMRGDTWLRARIDQIQAERPDIIVLGGDILEGDNPSEADLLLSLRRLSAPLGVWAVSGNHELHADAQNGSNNLERAGVHVLHDECTMVEPGLALAGVDDLISRRRTGETAGFVNSALEGCGQVGATILASHAPFNIGTPANAGVQLMLAGHTHNGQIWPFGYLVRLFNPYYSGAYEVGGMHLYVSRGAGTWGPRMRLWERGEILRITLRAQLKAHN